MKLYHFVLTYIIIAGVILAILYSVITLAEASAREEIRITDTLVNSCAAAGEWLRNEPEVITEELTEKMYFEYVRAVSVGLGEAGYSVTSEELSRYIPVFAVIADKKVRINYLKDISDGSLKGRIITDIIEIPDTVTLNNVLEFYVEKANSIAWSSGIKYNLGLSSEENSEITPEIGKYTLIGLFQNFPTKVYGYTFNRTVLTGITTEHREIPGNEEKH